MRRHVSAIRLEPERRRVRAGSAVSQTSGMTIAAINKAAATRPAGVARAVAVMAIELADTQVQRVAFISSGWTARILRCVASRRSYGCCLHSVRVAKGRRMTCSWWAQVASAGVERFPSWPFLAI